MKHAIVTGASTGIGREIAITLAKEDYHVFLLSRDRQKLEDIKKLVIDSGGQADVVAVDLSSNESLNYAIHTIKSKTSSIDLLVNVAGIWHGQEEVYAGVDFETFNQQVIIDTLNVGILAPILLSHAFIALMKPGSKIINLSGTFEKGAKGWLPYYVSKRAIEDLTIGLSQELSDRNIQVNCISPSDTATEAYVKYFPDFINDAIDPQLIGKKVIELCEIENKTTGKVIVMKKNTDPFESFHF